MLPTEQEIEKISQMPFEERIPALKKVGIICDVGLLVAACGIRPIVVAKVDGVKQPFYRSANGSSGKSKGEWFPFFGFGRDKATVSDLSWMVKGTLEQVNTNYGSVALKYLHGIINGSLNWEHALDLKPGTNKYFHPYINLKDISKGDFNYIIYGKRDRGIVHGPAYSDKTFDTISSDIKNLDKAFQNG